MWCVVDEVTYYLAAEGQGPPLLLLHGFTGSHVMWEPFQAIWEPSLRLIAPDLLGHGRTSVPAAPARYAMPRAAADLAALLSQLGFERTHLLGYSMGGRLALYFALHYPHLVHTLILESSSPGLATAAERVARQRRDHALAEQIEREGVADFVDFWEQLPLWESQQRLSIATRQQLHQQRLQNSPQGLANSLRGMGAGEQPSLWGALDELTMSVLLLVGALDKKFVALNEQMAQRLPSAVLHIVPEVGHAIHLEQPEHFAQAVLTFLAERSR